MERVIKFRGMRVDDSEWIVGDFRKSTSRLNGIDTVHCFIGIDTYLEYEIHEVHPESVGQFTGLIDKAGREIFEGDVVKVKGTKRVGEYVTDVIFEAPMFKLRENKTYLHDYAAVRVCVEIIGNSFTPITKK